MLTTSVARARVLVGELLDLNLTLTNSSAGTLEACLGQAKSYHFFGTKKDAGLVSTIDHAGCVTRFRLGPGEKLEWSEPIQVEDIGLGPAKLFASVQIVAPEGCDRTSGCHHTSLGSPFVPLEVVSVGSQEAQ